MVCNNMDFLVYFKFFHSDNALYKSPLPSAACAI